MKLKRFFIRLFNYEYWPMWAFYLPLTPYLLYKGILKGNLFFFSNVNRGMDEFGGLLFESKTIVDNQIPQDYRPKTIVLPAKTPLKFLEKPQSFPVILKPDDAERGKGIFKINNLEEWESHQNSTFSSDYLIQEFIDSELELGVFIAYDTDKDQFIILSITQKKYFSVVGDGRSTVHDLVLKSHRGVVFYDEIKEKSQIGFEHVPELGEQIVLHKQGNHCKGTQFIDVSYRINENINLNFNKLLNQLHVFEYGRFDLKCNSIEDLESENGLKNIKIIEFNGTAAEPIHIYDSSIGYFNSLIIYTKHWHYLFKISNKRMKEGVMPHSSKKTIEKIWHKWMQNTKK
jgi:hypothetical protein